MWLRGYLAYVAFLSITGAMWAASTSVQVIDLSDSIAELLGALALSGFACVFLISTRWGMVDRLFDGQDKAYVAHRGIAVLSIGLVMTHMILFAHTPGTIYDEMPELAHVGRPSLVIFLVLTAFALIARKLKYEVWRIVHRFLAVPYAIGLVHYYGSTSFGALAESPLSIWMNVVNLIGVASVIYTILVYPHSAFRFHYSVSHVEHLTPGTVEITGTTTGKPLVNRPGQFAFLRFPRHRFGSHPFTISSASTTDSNQIQFTIKALGDHTSALVKEVEVGDEFDVAGPYGQFDYTNGFKNQIWIAGGVGVTPFHSFLESGVSDRFDVDFFYAHPGTDESIYVADLEALESNVRIHLSDDKQDGFLTADRIASTVTIRPVDMYFCGPPAMRRALRAGMKSAGIPVRQFHYERFGFGR